MSRCYAYIVAYISRLEIGNVVLRPARLEVGHYESPAAAPFRPTPRLLVCAVHDGHDQEVVAPTVGLLTERVFILGDTWLGLFALVSVDSTPVR